MERPVIPGYNVSLHEGRWRARRRGGLSPAMLAYGCRGVVVADSYGELLVLTTAEQIKESIVGAAECLVQQMADAELRRSPGCCDEAGAGS